jgi:hypothetical protein
VCGGVVVVVVAAVVVLVSATYHINNTLIQMNGRKKGGSFISVDYIATSEKNKWRNRQIE